MLFELYGMICNDHYEKCCELWKSGVDINQTYGNDILLYTTLRYGADKKWRLCQFLWIFYH